MNSALPEPLSALGLLVALLIAIAPVCLVPTQSGLPAGGNTITVNNTTDPATTPGNGFRTLREAIDNANSPWRRHD